VYSGDGFRLAEPRGESGCQDQNSQLRQGKQIHPMIVA
jgi:hypothetical protein